MFDAAKKAEQTDDSSSEEDLKKEQFLAPMEEEFNLFMQNSTFYSSQEQLQDPADFTYADKDAPAADLAALEESSEEAASETDEDAILAALAIAEGDLLDEDDAESAERDFWLASRQWEFSLNVSMVANMEVEKQSLFYVFTFGHVSQSQKKLFGGLKTRSVYTPQFNLKSGEIKTLPSPLGIIPSLHFKLPYKMLKNFSVRTEMWSASRTTFNEKYAQQIDTLEQLTELDPTREITLTHQRPSDGKNVFVNKLMITSQLSEIFQFDLFFESWTYHPEVEDFAATRRRFILESTEAPRGRVRRMASPYSDSDYWGERLFVFEFTGTKSQMKNHFGVVRMMVVGPDGREVEEGRGILTFSTVQDTPHAKVTIKRAVGNRDVFVRGTLVGEIKFYFRSVGLNFYEDTLLKRPEQDMTGASLVNQLDLRERYLVFRLFKAEYLPAADIELYTSNPKAEIKWDAMAQTSVVKRRTLRPKWNQNFYFPVRLLHPDLTKPRNRPVLALDLEAKGPVEVNVWDNNDGFTAELLGTYRLTMFDLLTKAQQGSRSLSEGVAQTGGRLGGRPAAFRYVGNDDSESESEEAPSGDLPVYERKLSTAIYYGQGVELSGSSVEWAYVKSGRLKSPTRPILFFEAYFIPPLPEDIPVEDSGWMERYAKDVWGPNGQRFAREMSSWAVSYYKWFPDAPKPRNFSPISKHPGTYSPVPLTSFLASINVPQELRDYGELMAWVRLFTFVVSPTESTIGTLGSWTSPGYCFISRKSSVQDHCLILASALIAMGVDAYVCVGTVNDCTEEHAWVMTRHEDRWVEFWEPTSGLRYSLPHRYMWTEEEMGYLPEDVDYEGPQDSQEFLDAMWDYGEQLVAEDYPGEYAVWAEDADIAEDYLQNETVETQLTSKPLIDVYDSHKTRNERMRQIMQDDLSGMPICPRKFLLDYDRSLAYVPYTSVDLVFNMYNVWGNLQNHHPALIGYDLEYDNLWKPFLPEGTQLPPPVDRDVIIGGRPPQKLLEKLQQDIINDIWENIQLQRHKRGMDTPVENSPALEDRVHRLFDMLEFRSRLDQHLDPGPPVGHQGWSSASSARGFTDGKFKRPPSPAASGALDEAMWQDVGNRIQPDEAMNPENTNRMKEADHQAAAPSETTFAAFNRGNFSFPFDGMFLSSLSSCLCDPSDSRLDSMDLENQPPALPPQKVTFMRRDHGEGVGHQERSVGDSDTEIEECQKRRRATHPLPRRKLDPEALDPVKSRYLWRNFLESFVKSRVFSSLYGSESDMSNGSGSVHIPRTQETIERQKLLDQLEELRNDPTLDVFVSQDELQPSAKRRIRRKVRHKSDNEGEFDVRYEDYYDETGGILMPTDWAAGKNEVLSDEEAEEEEEYEEGWEEEGYEDYGEENGAAQRAEEDQDATGGADVEGEEREGIPFNWLRPPATEDDEYAYKCHKLGWLDFYAMEEQYFHWFRSKFPGVPDHYFIGFPMHVATTNLTQLNSFLMNSVRFKSLINLPVETAIYNVYCKAYPNLNGLASIWVFIGCQVSESSKITRF